jgi:hypothetical protein
MTQEARSNYKLGMARLWSVTAEGYQSVTVEG